MISHKEDNKRIARNSLFLYIRSIVIMAVSLYTSRVVLNTLGFEDHGIYNVVGSVVVMFNMFSATFMSATQRFLNVELGKGNKENVTKVFSASINIHICLSIFIFVLLETVGLYLLNTKLSIPGDRLLAANWVFQFSVLTFIVNLISIPYNAVIIAYEKMGVYAYISIYEVVMKLFVIYILHFFCYDKLILYGLLLFCISLSIRVFYSAYCKRHFKECTYTKIKDKELYKSILSISGWNFLGSGASIITSSGSGLILNYFTNVVVNSANGIASQVTNTVTQLVQNFMIALRPQITKSYATGEQMYMLELISKGSRFSFFLSSFLCFPLICQAEPILRIWLKDIPPYTTIFVQLSLIYILQSSFSTILDMVLMATGRIRYPQIWLSIFQLMNIPLIIVFFLIGMPPYCTIIAGIIISYITLVIRLLFSVKYTDLTVSYYFTKILGKLVIPVIVVVIVSYWISDSNGSRFISILMKSFYVELSLISSFFIFATTRREKDYIVKYLLKYLINKQY